MNPILCFLVRQTFPVSRQDVHIMSPAGQAAADFTRRVPTPAPNRGKFIRYNQDAHGL